MLIIRTKSGEFQIIEIHSLPVGPAAPASAMQPTRPHCAAASNAAAATRALTTETLAHLTALAVHLKRVGKTNEARAMLEKRDRIAGMIASR